MGSLRATLQAAIHANRAEAFMAKWKNVKKIILKKNYYLTLNKILHKQNFLDYYNSGEYLNVKEIYKEFFKKGKTIKFYSKKKDAS